MIEVMTPWWHRLLILDGLPGTARLGIKAVILAATAFLVTYPLPDQFVRHVWRWRSPNQLIEPSHPGLEPLVEELRPRLENVPSPAQALRVVERFVYEKVPYEWDWNTWGAADYIPTVSEILSAGREDCDGRAVLAASLLTHLGYDAQIVTDFAHVWVKTPDGETMGPGKTKAVVATPEGIQVQPGAVAQLAKSIGYGISVFPLYREAVLLLILWYLLLHRRSRWWMGVTGLVFLVAGLLTLRAGGRDHLNLNFMQQWGGLGLMLAGLAVCGWRWDRAAPAER